MVHNTIHLFCMLHAAFWCEGSTLGSHSLSAPLATAGGRPIGTDWFASIHFILISSVQLGQFEHFSVSDVFIDWAPPVILVLIVFITRVAHALINFYRWQKLLIGALFPSLSRRLVHIITFANEPGEHILPHHVSRNLILAQMRCKCDLWHCVMH